MTGPLPACPECGALQLRQPDPRGVLGWQHDQACALLRSEDSRQAADDGIAREYGAPFTRPTTAAERLLLDAAGYRLPDEVQTLALRGATGGTFRLPLDGETSAALPWNATAAAVQAVLEQLEQFAPGDVTVTEGPLPDRITLRFGGTRAGQYVPPITVDPAGLQPASGRIESTSTPVTVVLAPSDTVWRREWPDATPKETTP